MLSITKRGRSDSHLLVQKGTKNRDKPPIEVTVTQGISVIVRGPGSNAYLKMGTDNMMVKSGGLLQI